MTSSPLSLFLCLCYILPLPHIFIGLDAIIYMYFVSASPPPHFPVTIANPLPLAFILLLSLFFYSLFCILV